MYCKVAENIYICISKPELGWCGRKFRSLTFFSVDVVFYSAVATNIMQMQKRKYILSCCYINRSFARNDVRVAKRERNS